MSFSCSAKLEPEVPTAMALELRVSVALWLLEPMRPVAAAKVTPPTARTAAMMMKRSRLWEIALRRFRDFIND